MLVVASALFLPPDLSAPATIAAIMEDDLDSGTPAENAEAQRLSAAANGGFVASEVIVVPHGTDILGATIAAKAWAHSNAERLANLAMLFYWDQDQLKTQVNEGGLLSGTCPVPKASTEDVERVLIALSESPDYRSQKIVAISSGGTPVAMQHGRTVRLGLGAKALLKALDGQRLDPTAIQRLDRAVDAAFAGGK